MNKFFLLIGSDSTGPFDTDEVWRMLANDEITGDTLFCREGDQSWKPVASMDKPQALTRPPRSGEELKEYRAAKAAEMERSPAERLARCAGILARIAIVLLGLSALKFLGAVYIVFNQISQVVDGKTPVSEFGDLAWCALFLVAGAAVFIFSQLMRIRVALERR